MSETLSTVTTCTSTVSSCFQDSCVDDAGESDVTSSGERSVLIASMEEDGYKSDQAVCSDDIIIFFNSHQAVSDGDGVCYTKKPIPSNERDGYMQAIDRDVMKKEARQIAERLLHEQTIAMEAWDEVATEYHRRIEPFTSAFVPHLLHHKYLSLKDESSYLKGKSVLDVAAGTGAGALYAISKGASFAMATDFSKNMLQVLQNRIRDHGCALPRGVLGTRVANGLCLPLAWENKYDVVLSNFGCIYFSRVDQGLREMVRCAKTGGKVCLSAWGSREETHAFNVFPAAIKRCGLDRRWHRVQAASRKDMLELFGTIPSWSEWHHSRRKMRYSGISLAPNYYCPTSRISSSQRFLFSMMTDAGLDDVLVIPVTNEMRLDDSKSYWKRFVLTSPNLKRFVDHCLSRDEVKQLRDAVSEILYEVNEEPSSSSDPQNGDVVLSASAYIAIGTKTIPMMTL
mmetsp:Transcript_1040/g.2528  ORF Transcript_1040/g.2528 Transcript_1040/m.2528 type:complete len:455 (+) Transcript_1040:539-1903(+)